MRNEGRKEFKQDGVALSRPIAPNTAPTAASINALFDSITYEKGGAVITMLNYTIGQAKFKAGLAAYLSRYQYTTATHNQLWNQLTATVAGTVTDWNGKGLNVTTFMDSWVEQMGFPLVTATRKVFIPSPPLSYDPSFLSLSRVT